MCFSKITMNLRVFERRLRERKQEDQHWHPHTCLLAFSLVVQLFLKQNLTFNSFYHTNSLVLIHPFSYCYLIKSHHQLNFLLSLNIPISLYYLLINKIK